MWLGNLINCKIVIDDINQHLSMHIITSKCIVITKVYHDTQARV